MTDTSLQDLRFQLVTRLAPSAPSIAEVEEAVRGEMCALAANLEALKPGSRIAITCGSRGIDRVADVVRAVCVAVRQHHCQPIIVPSMGSHAGGTAEGQEKLLADFGITESQIGAPILSSMDVVHVGTTPEGVDAYMDRVAWETGNVILLNRVKMHTDFDGVVESGLFKMLAVGLGKVEGAASFHRNSLRIGYETAILAMGRLLLSTGRIIGGIGLVENDRHSLCRVAAAPATDIEETERHLLEYSRQVHGRLPFDKLDLLIVDELGKNISGAGMDTKVIGRAVHPDRAFTKPSINIRRIYVRDLTEESGGNANGMGFADVIHERVMRKINFQVTYMNAATALAYRAAQMPMQFSNDRVALSFLLHNLAVPVEVGVRAAWIRNTLNLDEMLVTTPAAAELKGRPEFLVSDKELPLSFDPTGELLHGAHRAGARQ